MQPPLVRCGICSSEIIGSLYQLDCDCPLGAPACVTCKSMSGQRIYVGATVCSNCSRYKSVCRHANPLNCCVCLKSGNIRNPRKDLCDSLQALRTLKRNQHLRRRSEFFAMMAEDWGMFSSFYYQNYSGMVPNNLWTSQKKKAFFELWLRSQMRFLPYPQRMIQLCCNLWDTYPRYPLFISRRFSWRFLQLPWSRLLVCKMSAAVPSYKWLIMRIIVQYLMAQHAEICEITF